MHGTHWLLRPSWDPKVSSECCFLAGHWRGSHLSKSYPTQPLYAQTSWLLKLPKSHLAMIPIFLFAKPVNYSVLRGRNHTWATPWGRPCCRVPIESFEVFTRALKKAINTSRSLLLFFWNKNESLQVIVPIHTASQWQHKNKAMGYSATWAVLRGEGWRVMPGKGQSMTWPCQSLGNPVALSRESTPIARPSWVTKFTHNEASCGCWAPAEASPLLPAWHIPPHCPGALHILPPAPTNLANVLSCLSPFVCDSSPPSKANRLQMKSLHTVLH